MPSSGFSVPEVDANPDGWGPTTVPEQLDGIPYAPFGKGDKIGRVSDFTNSGFNKYGGRGFQQNREPGIAVFNFFANDEEDSFHLVDTRPTQRNRGGPRRFGPNRFQQAQRQREAEAAAAAESKHRQPRKKQQARMIHQYQRSDQRQMVYSSSVDIRPEWAVVEQIPFTALAKLHYSAGDAEDLAFVGQLHYYDKSYDRVTPKADKPLRRTRRQFRTITASRDPILQRLAAEGAGTVFVTDNALTMLMCGPRSVYSWDLVISKEDGKIWIDRRDQEGAELITVAETAPEAVAEDKDSINGIQQLSQEATLINQSFSQQVLSTEEAPFKAPEQSPFRSENGGELAPVAHKYRRVALGGDQTLVVRCEVDAIMHYKGADQLLAVKALNEFDPKLTGVDWRQKIENQRGAVLATELKNNANKLARWTSAALVAGVDLIKLGYVARAHPRDRHHHVILSTQAVKPKDFAMQINLSMENCWGIVRALVDVVAAMDDGKYLLVKDPNKPLVRLYAVPADAFQRDDYEEEPLQDADDADEPATPVAVDDD